MCGTHAQVKVQFFGAQIPQEPSRDPLDRRLIRQRAAGQAASEC